MSHQQTSVNSRHKRSRNLCFVMQSHRVRILRSNWERRRRRRRKRERERKGLSVILFPAACEPYVQPWERINNTRAWRQLKYTPTHRHMGSRHCARVRNITDKLLVTRTIRLKQILMFGFSKYCSASRLFGVKWCKLT